jgi:hypothetical protein
LQQNGKKIGLDVQVDISPPCDQQFLPVSFLSGTELVYYPGCANYLSLFYSENFSPNTGQITTLKVKNSTTYTNRLSKKPMTKTLYFISKDG